LRFSNSINPSLPSELGNLNKLEYLSLCCHGLVGPVPSSISNLSLLSGIDLSYNYLTDIPMVQNLTKLTSIDLSPLLSYLVLSYTHFTGPIEVLNSSSSSKLEILSLRHTHFEGKILEPISKLNNIIFLDLSFLNTSYPLDLSLLSSFQSLWHLDISGNNIFPASLSSDFPLTLEWLLMAGCGIKDFPNSLKTLVNLEMVELSYNRIKGKVPKRLWSLPRLSTVYLQSNMITGFEGSSEILVNSAVQLLSLGYNNFTGLIPQCLSNFKYMNLRNNNLEGSIPDKFFSDAPLETLDVGYNQITGKLPRSLLNCSFLEFLSVDNNQIEDTFPFSLKALPSLRVLILSSNQFYGHISPPHQGPHGFSKLQIFEISNNKFTGSLPPSYFEDWKASSLNQNEYKNLYMVFAGDTIGPTSFAEAATTDRHYKGSNMKQAMTPNSYATIDLSGNKLEGQIPEFIGLLKALIAINLSNNAFTGGIPLSVSNLTDLESLDLSRNQLSGTIPNGLGSLSFLAYINPKSSFEGDAGLCGLPLDETCFGSNVPQAQHSIKDEDEDEEEEQLLNWKAVAIAYGPEVLLGLTIAQIIASYKPEWLVKIIGPTKRRNR
ncbi:hypothetical protein EUTSA_v10019617mg, partial [Eutrema salsugineum]